MSDNDAALKQVIQRAQSDARNQGLEEAAQQFDLIARRMEQRGMTESGWGGGQAPHIAYQNHAARIRALKHPKGNSV